jgi:HYR domain-containing protein
VTAQPPLISVPENVVGEADSPTGGHVTFVVSGFSFVDPPPAPTITCNHNSGDFFPLGSTTVNCTATDSFGSAFGSFEVFVADSLPPVITVPANFSSNTSLVTYSVSAVDAVDGTVPVTCSPASGSLFPNGAITVTCSAEDLRNNVSYATFVVTVSDPGQPPALTVPEDFFVEATSSAGAIVTYSVTAGAGATVACSPASGTRFALGVTAVACSATSPGGTTNATFNVTVVDTAPPVLTLPGTIHVEATSASGAAVTYSVSASDAISGAATVTCNPPSGSTFPLGTTTVQCSAQDASFNIGFGSFDVVVVQDLTPPVIVSVTATPNNLWPPDHKATPITITVIAVDAIDPHPTSHIVGVSSNQPINGIGDGNTLTDWTITGPLTLNVLNERTGGSDRVYTITIASTDASGNSSFGTVTVTVSQPRGRASRH